eukprot:902388-Pyramimonas_sp.AAC.2
MCAPVLTNVYGSTSVNSSCFFWIRTECIYDMLSQAEVAFQMEVRAKQAAIMEEIDACDEADSRIADVKIRMRAFRTLGGCFKECAPLLACTAFKMA